MKELTHEEINKIIDSIKPHAKTICDRIYNEAINNEIEGKEQFKSLIDKVFDDVSQITIDGIKDNFDEYFKYNKFPTMTIQEIQAYFITCEGIRKEIKSAVRDKMLTKTIIMLIDKSVQQAFAEKLAEYIGTDISEVIN